MTDLAAWLRERLDEDEAWARAACQAYAYTSAPTLPEGGVHWRWVAGPSWDTVTPDPVTDYEGLVGFDEGHVNLATVEKWPTDRPGRLMPRTYAAEIVEMDSSAAGHIVRWDPARVLAEVEAKRRILDLHAPSADGSECEYCSNLCHSGSGLWCPDPHAPYPCETVRLLALPYADQPGYLEEWRP